MAELYKRLIKFIVPYWVRLTQASACMIVDGALTGATAYLVQPVLDKVFFEKNRAMLLLIPAAIIILYFLKLIFNFLQSYLMSHIGQSVIKDLRNQVYRQIQSLSLSFFTKNPTGILISRVTNDINLVQGAVSTAFTGLVKDLFTIIALVGVVFYRDWKLAIIAFLVFPVAIVPLSRFSRKMRKSSTKSQFAMGNITTILHETITGTKIVKAFGMEEYENKRFEEENQKLFKFIMKVQKVRSISSPLMEFLGSIAAAAIVFYGGYSVIEGKNTPGNFFSFLTGVFMLYRPLKSLTNVNNVIQEGLAAAVRVFEILDTSSDVTQKEKALEIKGVEEGIRFVNVSFKYEDKVVLKNLNLSVKKGEVAAIVGASGSGKSTFVDLIPRFYDVSEGAVLIDGINIRDVSIASLRNQIGIVTQQTILFNDSVKNNIAYGISDVDFNSVINVAKAANADGFINLLPEKYDTIIGEQGIKLSGGERQRIAIARALLKNSPILILDEATSALDNESEREVQKALDRLMEGRTTFVIAHRLSTIRNADKIIVLSNGEMVEEGTHVELLAKKGEYFKLYTIGSLND